tara:strand:+ start:84 stop:488 length:405 start_codon:yes stop_codon:yes gene_type:complete
MSNLQQQPTEAIIDVQTEEGKKPIMKKENLDQLEFESATIRYVKPSELNNGDILVGVFKETKTSEFGPTYLLETDGETIGLNGCGSLNWQIDNISPTAGDVLKVTYGGMKTIEKGAMRGKDCHEFNVKVSRAKS